MSETANVETSKWYVLRVVSGKEKKVKEYLDKEIARNGWDNVVKQVFLPVEKVYKVANGKKVVRERNFYPGYVMIEVENGKMGDDIRETISNTSNVIHFLGKENPIALRKAEVNKMLGKVDEMADNSGDDNIKNVSNSGSIMWFNCAMVFSYSKSADERIPRIIYFAFFCLQ